MGTSRPCVSLLAAALLAAGCEGTAAGAGETPPQPEPRLLAGTAEKGPYWADAEVTITPVREDGKAAGAPVRTKVAGAPGAFEATVLGEAFLLEVKGRAYRELEGGVSAGTLTLRGFHAGPDDDPRLNVITHLARERALTLVGQGRSLAAAIAEAEADLHAALGLPHVPSTAGSALTIFGDGRDHAYLLVLSALLEHAAGFEGHAASDAGLQSFLAETSADLADDGTLEAGRIERIREANRHLAGNRVRDELADFVRDAGFPALVVPSPFAILDADLDGIPDEDDPPAIDPTLLAIVRDGGPARAVGAAGAITGGCRPWTARLFGAEPEVLGTATIPPDGSVPAIEAGGVHAPHRRLWLEVADDCGRQTAKVEITRGADDAAPAVVPTALQLVRRPAGAPDAFAAGPGAFTDESGVAEVAGYAQPDGGDPVFLAVPAADGSVAPVDFPADLPMPLRIWVEAADPLGNRTARTVVDDGAGDVPPAVDLERVRIERRPVGAADRVRAAPGAALGICRANGVVLAADAAGADPLGEAAVDSLGGFPDVPVGTAAAAPARVFIAARDKCGRTGPFVEIEEGRDVDPPVVDPTLVGVERRAGNRHLAIGLDGAATDDSAVARFLVTPEGGTAAHEVPAVRGGFAAFDLLRDDPVERVQVSAVDKSGNASAPVWSRRLRRPIAPEEFETPGRPEGAAFAFLSRVDPTSLSPGYGPWAAPRLDAEGRERIGVASAATLDLEAPQQFLNADPAQWQISLDPAHVRRMAVVRWDTGRDQVVVASGARADGTLLTDELGCDGTAFTPVGGLPFPVVAIAEDTHRGTRYLVGASDIHADDAAGNHAVLPLPPSGVGTSYLFDGARRRLLAIGPGGTYRLAGTGWVEAAIGQPAGVRAAALDPVTGRIVAIAASGSAQSAAELEGGGWSASTALPAACPPGPLVWDLVLDTFVVLGGSIQGNLVADCQLDPAQGWRVGGLDFNSIGGASDPSRGLFVRFGGNGATAFNLGGRHDRWPVLSMTTVLPEGAASLAVHVVAGGLGGEGTAAERGAELYGWSWAQGTWVSLGRSIGGPGAPGAEHTFVTALDDAGDWTEGDRLWLMLTTRAPSSMTKGPARLTVDRLEVALDELLPERP